MKVFHRILIAGLTILVCAQQPLAADEPASAPPQKIDGKLASLLKDLASPEFETRISASNRLRKLTDNELSLLVQFLPDEPSAEAVIRLLNEVDERYATKKPDDVAAASDALERLATHSRLLLADGAEQSLRQHWQKRRDLMFAELTRYGAAIRLGSLAPVGIWGGRPSAEVNIFLDEYWKGGDAQLDIITRAAQQFDRVAMRLYIIDGHPLSDDQLQLLSDAVGAASIAYRSRVALGISRHPATLDGVLISSVTEGGSAAQAGLGQGDLIVAIEDPKKQDLTGEALRAAEEAEILRDFDDLVERLKAYRPGDKIRLRVVRLEPLGRSEELVDVVLKGWYERNPETEQVPDDGDEVAEDDSDAP